MKYLYAVLMMVAFTGCASSTGVLPEGRDSFMVSREGGSAFVGVAGVKSAAYKEASEYCQSQGRQIQVTSTNSHPGGPMVYPAAEIHFQCLKDGDPSYTRTQMTNSPSAVVEVRHQ